MQLLIGVANHRGWRLLLRMHPRAIDPSLMPLRLEILTLALGELRQQRESLAKANQEQWRASRTRGRAGQWTGWQVRYGA